MSAAHRPTWEPAKAKADVSHISQVTSKHALPSQTRLKFRRPGDVQRRSLQELKDELVAGEKRAAASRNPEAYEAEQQKKRIKAIESTSSLDADDEMPADPTSKSGNGEEDGEDDDDEDEVSEDEDEEEEDDDTEALMRELEKIKQERREEHERREQRETVQEQLTREEEIARGNPLLNLESALYGRSEKSTTPAPQGRWDDDLIFRNQATGSDNGPSNRGFVNDLTLYERMSFTRSKLTSALHQVDALYSNFLDNVEVVVPSHSNATARAVWIDMGRYAVLVTGALRDKINLKGPAGAGKSTFCSSLVTHAHSVGRNMHLFNLDPAAEHFEYEPSIDIRELISLTDVMEEMDLGPNGGLIYCFDYLLNNLDWLEEELGNYDNDYLVIDCPGQIELYTHFPVVAQFISLMQQQFGFRVCATYLLDSHFMDDKPKYFAGVLSAMSTMINLDIPHLNIMTKMDLVYGANEKEGPKYTLRKEMERYMDPDPLLLADEINAVTNPKFFALNHALVQLIEDFSMVSFLPLDLTDEESITYVFSCIDNIVQYGEDEEPVEPKDFDQDTLEA